MSIPKFIYKIIPHSSVDPRFTFPVPIPSSHQFLTELDLKDKFIHLSTAAQVPKTLQLFFKDVPAVTLLRVETERIAAWKKIEWVMPDQTLLTKNMPYLCAHAWPVPLEGDDFDNGFALAPIVVQFEVIGMPTRQAIKVRLTDMDSTLLEHRH
ncbi:uncharacterized protein L203_104407 [Cryptococcus depauperatus CBS 7841]|uniref:Uncharacterized protein n=1 Tax=Cryptococcus depauperatus CBS 7841 TaxID=1295531 RepID=A0AAJ8M332_9TREE